MKNPHHHSFQAFYLFFVNSFLWCRDVSNIFQNLFFWGTNLQVIVFSLWIQLNLIIPRNNDDFFSYSIHKITEVLTLKKLTDFQNMASGLNFTMVAVWVYMGVLLLAILMIVVSFKVKQKISRAQNYCIVILSQFHLSVAFMTISFILINDLSSPSIINDLFMADKARRVINIILVIINFLITFFLSVFSYDPFSGSNKYSSHTPSFQVFTYLTKASFVAYIMIDNIYNPDQPELKLWMLVFLSLLLLIVRHYHVIKNFPFYNYIPQRTSMIMSSISLLISTFSFLALILRSANIFSEIIVIYVEMLLLPFVFKVSDVILDRIFENSLRKDDKQINSESDVIKKIFGLKNLMTNKSFSTHRTTNRYDLLFWGKISPFIKGSSKKSYEDSNDSESHLMPSECAKIIDNIAHQTLTSFAKRFHHNTKIKFLLANYHIEHNANLSASISFLLEVTNRKHFLQASAKRLVEHIQHMLYSYFNNGKALDIKNFIDFDSISTNFVEKIYKNSSRFIEFWEAYKKPNLELIKILKRSAIIEAEDVGIREIWNKNIQPQKLFASSLCDLYSTYILLVRNAPFSSLKLKKKYETFDFYSAQQETFLKAGELVSLDNIVLTVSMSRRQIGTVLHVSANVKKALEWNGHDLVGKNMDLLLMPFLREKHDQILVDHLEITNKLFILNHNFDGFVIDKENRVSPCHVYVSVHPYIQKELRYVAIIKLMKSDQDILVLNQNGDIESSSKNIGNLLKLPANKKINIKDICLYAGKSATEETKNFYEPSETFEPEKPQNINLGTIPILKRFSKEPSLRKNRNDVWTLIQSIQSKEFFIKLAVFSESPQIEKLDFKKYIATLEQKKMADLNYYMLILKRHPFEAKTQYVYSIDKQNLKFNEIEHNQAEIQNVKPKHVFIEKKISNQVTTITTANKKIFEKQMTKSSPKRKSPEEAKMKLNTTNSYHSSNDSKSNAKMEESVYAVPKNRSLKILNIMVLFLIVSTVSLLIIFESKNTKATEEFEGLVTVISASTMQLLVLSEYCRLSLYYTLIDRKVYATNRFDWANIPDIRIISMLRIPVEGENLAKYYTVFRNSMHLFDKDIQQMFFKKIPAIDWDSANKVSSIRESDPLNLLTEIIKAGRQIVLTPFQELDSNNKDVAFVLNNSRGDLLIAVENIVKIVVEDTTNRINNFPNFLLILISISGVMCAIFIGYLFIVQRKFILNRNRFLEIFLRLDEKEIQARLDAVRMFSSILNKNNMDGRNFKLDIANQENAKHAKSDGSSLSSQRKIASRKYINLNLIKIAIYSLLFVVSIFFGYSTLMLLLVNQNKVVKTKINMLVDSNLNFFECGMLISDTFDYVSSNDTAIVRGRPIKEEWEHTFKRVSELQDKLILVTDNERGLGGNDKLVQIIQGDLCEILLSDPYAGAQCKALIYGIVQKGIIQINTFFISVLHRAKQSFDYSGKTIAEKFNILSDIDYVQSEPVWTLYLLPGYQLINQFISEQLAKDLKTYREAVTVILSLFATLYLLVGLLLWWNIKITFEKEIMRWKELLRLIPDPVVSYSKILKAYLISNPHDRLI